MITLKHIYKTYSGPVHALRDVQLEINKGEFIFLTGKSGAGKTTLFRLLSAFDQPTSGEITVAGFRLNQIHGPQLVQFRRRVGIVFQDFKLLKDRSVFANVALPLFFRGDSDRQIRKKVFDVLESVGLSRQAEDLPEHLSGGEQQRVAIARAIVHQPGLLVADEPTGNLDPDLSEEIMNLFELVCAQGTTVVIATHDHGMVHRRNKRTLLMEQGSLFEATFAKPEERLFQMQQGIEL